MARHGEEVLEIKQLGPIRRAEIRPKRLTVLVGPPASGKSLVAQCLYLFRALETLVRDRMKPGLDRRVAWRSKLLEEILDSLRGAAFGYYVGDATTLTHTTSERRWSVSLRRPERAADVVVTPSRTLAETLGSWSREWEREPTALGSRGRRHIFVPTERAIYSRLNANHPSVLYADWQPEPLRSFANLLQSGASRRRRPSPKISQEVRKIERRALGGYAIALDETPGRWVFVLDGEEAAMPVEAIASGQAEAWPIFAIAAIYGAEPGGCSFYIEEPEAHLHPKAQLAVLEMIVRLMHAGNDFVVTTHSPYLLLALNNMLQAWSLKDSERNGALALDPEWVAAYRMRPGKTPNAIDLMDRKDTNLIDTDELESVAEQLGRQFERLLHDD